MVGHKYAKLAVIGTSKRRAAKIVGDRFDGFGSVDDSKSKGRKELKFQRPREPYTALRGWLDLYLGLGFTVNSSISAGRGQICVFVIGLFFHPPSKPLLYYQSALRPYHESA